MLFVSMLWCKLQVKCTGSWRYIIKNKALAKQLQHSNIVALLAATCCTCLATSVSRGAGGQNVWLPIPCSPDSLTYISQLLPLSILLTYLENNETRNTCSCAIVRHFISFFPLCFQPYTSFDNESNNIFMSYDFTTVELFPTLPEVNLQFLAQGQIFVCLLSRILL